MKDWAACVNKSLTRDAGQQGTVLTHRSVGDADCYGDRDLLIRLVCLGVIGSQVTCMVVLGEPSAAGGDGRFPRLAKFACDLALYRVSIRFGGVPYYVAGDPAYPDSLFRDCRRLFAGVVRL
jgi:hypothetical protein